MISIVEWCVLTIFKPINFHSYEEKTKNFAELLRIVDLPNKEQILLNKYLVITLTV